MCQQLFEQKDYKTLSHLILTDKRTYRLCQPSIKQLKLRGLRACDTLSDKYHLYLKRNEYDVRLCKYINDILFDPVELDPLGVTGKASRYVIRDSHIYVGNISIKHTSFSFIINQDLSCDIHRFDIPSDIRELFDEYIHLYLTSVDEVFIDRQRRFFREKMYGKVIGKIKQEALQILDKLGWCHSPKYPPEWILHRRKPYQQQEESPWYTF